MNSRSSTCGFQDSTKSKPASDIFHGPCSQHSQAWEAEALYLPQLRDRLAEQGLRIEQFEVDISQQEHREPTRQFSDTDPTGSPHRDAGDQAAEGDSIDDPESDAPDRPDLNDGTLNVVI